MQAGVELPVTATIEPHLGPVRGAHREGCVRDQRHMAKCGEAHRRVSGLYNWARRCVHNARRRSEHLMKVVGAPMAILLNFKKAWEGEQTFSDIAGT
jgi:hypothetical protein